MNEDVTVIYHANCYDGVTAAWVAHKKFGPGAQYVAMNYSDQPPDVRGRRVFMIDFSLKRNAMKELILYSHSTVVLDHHASAEKELYGILEEIQAIGQRHPSDEIVFDMNRSGAGIAWDYFFPDVTRPDLVTYVEDRDLWRFKLHASREVNAYVQSFDINLATWIAEFPVGNFHSEHTIIGEALLRQQSKLVREITANARMVELPEGRILPAKTPIPAGIFVKTGVLFSEVCEQMLKDRPEAPFAWYSMWRAKDGKTQFGLRSRAGSDVDVSEIAKLYGGGGHKHAAGFEL